MRCGCQMVALCIPSGTTFRVCLSAAQCPADIIDALGGWSAVGIGNSYGDGFELSQKFEWIRLMR